MPWRGTICARPGFAHCYFPICCIIVFPHLVIHGDIHSDDLCFKGDPSDLLSSTTTKQPGITRLTSITADALVGFATKPIKGISCGRRVWGSLDEDRAISLVAAYAVSRASSAEITALPLLVVRTVVVCRVSWAVTLNTGGRQVPFVSAGPGSPAVPIGCVNTTEGIVTRLTIAGSSAIIVNRS